MAVFDLSLEQVVPGPVEQLKTSNLEHCPKGLPLQNASVLEATFSDGEPEHSKDLRSKSKAKATPKAKALSSDQKAEFVISRLRESSSLRDIRPPVKEAPHDEDDESVFSHPDSDKNKRARWADVLPDDDSCSAGAASSGNKDNYASVVSGCSSETVLLPDVDQGRSSGADADLCESWLRDMSPLLSAYDCKLLRRYIPSLSTDSLQKVMTVSSSERITALANRREQSQLCVAEQQISKMAMRRVLETTFARLASAYTDIQEVHRHWQATNDKTNRKSKASTAKSALQYKQRSQNRFR